MKSAAEFLATELERLRALPLNSLSDVEQWYSECALTEQALRTRFPDFRYWHEVEHYFADADIRFRDGYYRAYQESLMGDYIALLRLELARV